MPASSGHQEGALIAVDWGTSRMRARLVADDGDMIASAESDAGVGRVSGGYEAVFEDVTSAWPKVPVIMAGMIGSRQGWREAPYLECPTSVAGLADSVLRFETAHGRPVAIVPGLMVRSPQRDGDVIRGEETQIVGLMGRRPGFAGVAIMPGTHSKWVSLDEGAIAGFQTFLTGELYELLSRHSFLRHSVAERADRIAEAEDFALAVRRTVEEGLPFLSAVFSVRVRHLLDNVAREDNLAYLSGLIIGGEIAAARGDASINAGDRVIIGTRSLAQAYARAFAILGEEVETIDGSEMAFAGLVRLARTIGLMAEEATA